MGITIRPAEEGDVRGINEIYTYYVEHTVITFSMTPYGYDDALKAYKAVIEQGLPYIVAVDQESETIHGYCYASGFRGQRGAYRHTVEFSLFLDHEHKGKGTGSLLLKTMLQVLRNPENFSEYVKTPRPADSKIRNVIGCMSVDESGPGKGLGLKHFYERFGFEEVGHLKKVGHKFDRW